MKNKIIKKEHNLQEIKQIASETNKLIEKGLSKKTASTGTPINNLNGGAKFMAQLSNVGGGSKETGGQGIQEGFNTIMKNQSAKSALSVMEQVSEKKKISKK